MTFLPPGSTIGILGAGQLGRMLALAAARLGLKCHVYSDASGPAFDVAAKTTVAPFEDVDALRVFARSVDAVTYEFENIPVEAAAAVADVVPLHPGVEALRVSQDRLDEKRFLAGLGLAVAPFADVTGPDDLDAALATAGAPAILKTRRFGYDGKGQVRVSDAKAASRALAKMGGTPLILEGVVGFWFEVSCLAVRSASGDIRFYDVPINTHEGGVLRTSETPSPLSHRHAVRAHDIAGTIAEALEYVGVLCVEMFYVGDDAAEPLVVNEIAPRVHNSGHWTIDACAVSQFENHIRAVAGWPLGDAWRHSDARMTNLLGVEILGCGQYANNSRACLHVYGKRDPRPGRKMGHVTELSPLTAPCLAVAPPL